MLTTEDVTNASTWQKFTTLIKKASVATGNGLVYLYKTSDEHKHHLIPIIHGLVGDTLAENNHSLTINMSFRKNRQDVTVEELCLEERLIGKGQHLVVFAHGLMGNEVIWQSNADEQSLKYGTLLEQELGITSIYIRYNTGLHISENGKSLAQLLQQLFDVYGENISQITLLGYSMGGLVVRSAGYYANQQHHRWLTRLSSVILMSVPNDGAYLEQFGHLTTSILRKIPNLPTRLVAEAIDQRSDGIKDLRHGWMVEEDWKHPDCHRLLNVPRTSVNPLPGVTYHIIAGTIAQDEMSPLAVFFGDGLVSKHSALGKTFANHYQSSSQQITYQTFPKMNHATMLNNLEVYQYIKSLLTLSEVAITV